MSDRVGVLVHGADRALGEALVGAVTRAEALGEVRAVEAVDDGAGLAPACRRLAELCTVVVGIGAAPWPGWGAWHDAARAELGDVPYWAVETWHGMPALHAALVAALGEVPAGAQVVVTAPDAALAPLPVEQRTVLKDVAEALHGRTGIRPVVAVDHSPAAGGVTPTAVTTVGTLGEAHGATHVVRLSLAPGDDGDPAVTAAAAAAGLRLTDVALDTGAQVALLLDAVRTMLRQALPGDGT